MRVNVVQRKDNGQYRVKVTAKDETGRWITKWVKGGFYTEQEAKARKAEIEANAAKGNIETLDRSTVAGYCKEWLDTRRTMGKIEASSAWSYRVSLKRILDHIGKLPLATLSYRDIQAAYTRIVATKGNTAAYRTHVVFQGAIKDAVRTGRLLADPFARVEPPRAKKARKPTTLTAEQVSAFVKAHKGTELGRLIELLAVTGMRVGEACALQWRDFDFDRNRLRIERNMALLEDGTSYLKSPKTEAGFRTVSVTPETLALFQPLAGKPTEPVFKDGNSRIWSRRITRALKHAGLGQFSTHDLRHAHATYLLQLTGNPKAVSQRLGHSDVKITLGVYAHVFEKDDEELGGLASGLIWTEGKKA